MYPVCQDQRTTHVFYFLSAQENITYVITLHNLKKITLTLSPALPCRKRAKRKEMLLSYIKILTCTLSPLLPCAWEIKIVRHYIPISKKLASVMHVSLTAVHHACYIYGCLSLAIIIHLVKCIFDYRYDICKEQMYIFMIWFSPGSERFNKPLWSLRTFYFPPSV